MMMKPISEVQQQTLIMTMRKKKYQMLKQKEVPTLSAAQFLVRKREKRMKYLNRKT